MSKYTIQETESINSRTGARERIYVVGIEGEKTDANGFWELKTREEAEAKVRELESKCRYCGADAYYLEEPLAYLAIYRVDKGERIVDLCLDCASIIENKLKITD